MNHSTIINVLLTTNKMHLITYLLCTVGAPYGIAVV